MTDAGSDDASCVLFCTVTMSGWLRQVKLCRSRGVCEGCDCVLAIGAPSVLNSTPADAVVSLETMVLLMKFTLNAVFQRHAGAIPAGNVVA